MKPARSLTANTARGALLGGLVGGVLIGIGVIRGLLALLGGGRFAPLTSADLRVLVFYVGTFVIVGAILGALRIQERGKVVIVLSAMAAGVLVMLAIVAADKGGLGGMSRVDWIGLPALGALFGGAAAYGYLRR